MARSIWKGPFVDGYLLKKAEKARVAAERNASAQANTRDRVLGRFSGFVVRGGFGEANPLGQIGLRQYRPPGARAGRHPRRLIRSGMSA